MLLHTKPILNLGIAAICLTLIKPALGTDLTSDHMNMQILPKPAVNSLKSDPSVALALRQLSNLGYNIESIDQASTLTFSSESKLREKLHSYVLLSASNKLNGEVVLVIGQEGAQKKCVILASSEKNKERIVTVPQFLTQVVQNSKTCGSRCSHITAQCASASSGRRPKLALTSFIGLVARTSFSTCLAKVLYDSMEEQESYTGV